MAWHQKKRACKVRLNALADDSFDHHTIEIYFNEVIYIWIAEVSETKKKNNKKVTIFWSPHNSLEANCFDKPVFRVHFSTLEAWMKKITPANIERWKITENQLSRLHGMFEKL